jgi:hypothetical protein
LLKAARRHAKQVSAERLGAVGSDAFPRTAYAVATGCTEFGTGEPVAEIPFVVECWAVKADRGRDTTLLMCVNRTPVASEIYAAREKRDIDIFGGGLSHMIARAPIDVQFAFAINVTTPFMPITSDGKEPDLNPFFDAICTAAEKAVRKAHRPTAATRVSQKDIVFENLTVAVADVGGGEELPFNQRQLFYVLRPIVKDETGETLKTPNFNTIITDYENEFGEIPGMYREPRGSIYHPHTGETITLGTLTVEDYERPAWLYNKALYIEKEGWLEALKAVRWFERNDCMPMSSKGFTTRAARDLVDKLAAHDEPVTIFCAHDADAYGTMIYQTFQEETKARGARRIRIVNLGIEPWEAIEMGLEVEEIAETDRRKPVADYVLEREDDAPNGDTWEEWLQTNRVELNAMTTPQFIAWLDRKMAVHAKLIPPLEVLEAELDERIEEKVREVVTARILREADVDGQVAAAIAAIKAPDCTALAAGIKHLFDATPDAQWRDHIENVADELAGGEE